MHTRTLMPGIMPLSSMLCAASRQSHRVTRSAGSPYPSDTDFNTGSGCPARLRPFSQPVLGPLGSRLDEVKAAVEEYQRAGYQLGVTVQFVLLCPALLQHNQPEAALEVIDQGLSIVGHNSERFFEAELYRLKARALLMRG